MGLDWGTEMENGQIAAGEDSELDLRRLANTRMARRIGYFVLTGVAAVSVARYSGEMVRVAREFAVHETGIEVPEAMLFSFGFGLFVFAVLAHLLYVLATMVWKWRTFVPMLESKKPEEAAIALMQLTSVFATAQRTAQSRQLIGFAALLVGLFELIKALPSNEPIDGAVIPLSLVAMGGATLIVSFWLRYALPYSRVILVPLLQAIIGAEESKLEDSVIDKKVAEIVARIRKQKPWWFIRPTWFL